MHKILLAAALLLPLPLQAAELWCMPETICRSTGECHSTTDEEQSLRIHDMKAAASTMRSHVETIAMVRANAGTAVEWTGTNERGHREYVIWTKKTGEFTYTVTDQDGTVWKSTGACEVQ